MQRLSPLSNEESKLSRTCDLSGLDGYTVVKMEMWYFSGVKFKVSRMGHFFSFNIHNLCHV